jgi:hypothetical protein
LITGTCFGTYHLNELIMGAKNKPGIADIIVIVLAWMIAIMLVYLAFVKLRLFFHH